MKLDPVDSRKPFVIRSEDMDADEFGAIFNRMFGGLYSGLARPERKIVIAGVYGRYEGVSFRRLSFRGDFITELPDVDDEITFVFPTAGRIVFTQSSETVGVPQIALAIEKATVRSVGFSDGHAQYGLSVRRAVFARRLAALLERPIVHKVRFRPVVDLNSKALQGIKAIVGLATSVEFDQLVSSGALVPARLQEMFIDSLLEAWPHNYSEALECPGPGIAPRHVKLAVEYIQEHPAARVSGSELAALANVSQRALQEGFRRFLGSSIVAYQRQVRLQQARDAFRLDACRSVSEVSRALGFTNVGRFCQYFQSAFGMSPAEFRKNSRGS